MLWCHESLTPGVVDPWVSLVQLDGMPNGENQKPTLDQKVEWERITGGLPIAHMYRARVPGGWLVWAQRPERDGERLGGAAGMTFLPDPHHVWMTTPEPPVVVAAHLPPEQDTWSKP